MPCSDSVRQNVSGIIFPVLLSTSQHASIKMSRCSDVYQLLSNNLCQVPVCWLGIDLYFS